MTTRSATGLTALSLRLANIPGRTRVITGAAATMDIELSGPARMVRDISWEVRNGTLHVTGPEGTGGGGITISGGNVTIRGGSGVVIGNGKVVSGPGAGEPAEVNAVELTVTVPAGAGVQITDDGAGDYELGDVRGTLDLRIEGHSTIRAGAVRGTRISVGGSARIEVASVLDTLRADISGSGRISVLASEVNDLRLSVSGSGRIGYAGTAAEADLDISGSGRIQADTVTGSLRRNVSGSGSIDVREQPRRGRDEFWS